MSFNTCTMGEALYLADKHFGIGDNYYEPSMPSVRVEDKSCCLAEHSGNNGLIQPINRSVIFNVSLTINIDNNTSIEHLEKIKAILNIYM